MAATTATAQYRQALTRCRPCVWVRMNIPGSNRAVIVDAAFTPPISRMATPERAQPPTTAAGRPRPREVTRGRTAQGASRPGKAPADVEPITMVTVGPKAQATPASLQGL